MVRYPPPHLDDHILTNIQVLTGILRHYAMTLLQTAPKKQDLPKIRQNRSLVRGVNLRTNANVISPSSFAARKSYMVQAYQEGKFLADPESRGKPRPNPMSDPAAMEGMMGMMKGNMAMMIPQSLIMGWINAFFSGFVISEFLPFPLRSREESSLVADCCGRSVERFHRASSAQRSPYQLSTKSNGRAIDRSRCYQPV
jgi:hypothetical protein